MAYEAMRQKDLISKCFLCNGAPCDKQCPYGIPVSRMIRALRFENPNGVALCMPKDNPCITCENPPCMKACLRNKVDAPVEIKSILKEISKGEDVKEPSPDLSIHFCGVPCENPFFLSSSVVGSNYEMVAKAFDMGWAGVAFKTIGTFVPKEVSPRFCGTKGENGSLVGFKNIEQISDHTLKENLSYLKRLKEEYPSKIIIASIMGQNEEEWTYLASKMEEVGADIIECNFSCPHMSGEGLGSDVGTDKELVRRYTLATRKGTKLPILAKMTPNITNIEVPALAAIEAGADGIAAINTIKSIMNIDSDTFVSGPDVLGKSAIGGYSGKAIKPIALRFIHDIKSNPYLADVPVSGMGGIETWKDAVEFMALGCETVQITTAVMEYGYRIIEDLIEGLVHYMLKNKLESVRQIIGKALLNILPAEQLNRSSICYPKFHRDVCVGCGRCYVSCYDGGHQALTRNESGKPVLDSRKCVGCQLCKLVCPVGAIASGTRVSIP